MKMSKGLEALHRIANAKNHFKYDTLELVDKDFQIVQQELLRLEALEKGKITDITDNYMAFKNDNTKPSEALEELFKTTYFGSDEEYKKIDNCYNTIKQALLKAQEQEKENNKLKGQVNYLTEAVTEFQKMLMVIFEKNVSIFWIKECKSLKEYNYNVADYMKLTQEDFDLVKRYFK